ncbi:TonB-dependent siderophore receptor [Sphingomonas sp.]|uniref:TonB-dependent receptor n=1 Tax=Sphingomonas sp. TaxID=28214 RepID=UPI0025DD2C6C|nr:TonB-dependent siderophore receptor [Sphingomonas sp.]
MRSILISVSPLALLASAAHAAPGGADTPEPVADEVVVTGQRLGYGTDETSTATRTPVKLLDLPQSVTAITKQQIDDQAIRTIGDALRQVPGAIAAQGEGNRDQIVLRGQNTTADFFVDNLRDDVQYYRPVYNLERLEVLRGPNAMIFGRGGGGGVINRVTKTPFDGFGLGATASADSFGAWYLDGDLNLAVAPGVTARVNAVHEEVANHRNRYGGNISAVNPVVRFALGDRTSVTVGYEYQADRRVVDRGVPSQNGRPLSGFRDTFFGVPGFNRTAFTANVLRVTATHRFSDNLQITGRLLYGEYDKFYRNAFPSAPVTAAGLVPIQAYEDFNNRRNLFSQTDLVWRVTTGPIAHTVLAGAEFGDQRGDNGRFNGFFDGQPGASADALTLPVRLSDPVVIPVPILRAGTGQRAVRYQSTIFAGYAQDQLKWGPIELLLGLRYDSFTLNALNRLNGQTLTRADGLWSPRVGLVGHPTNNVSLYFSYARSYLPQSGDQFTTLDVTSAALIPERFDNYEVGAKWEPRAGLLLAASLYQLERTNTRAPGPTPGTTVLTGAQRSRGLELEARGQITKAWNLSLAYALTEAVITETTAAAPAGRRVPLVPRHTFSAFTRYDVTPRFGVGGGVSYFSDRATSISNAVTLPAYTRVDAALYYKLTKNIEAQVNIENLFDAGYFPTAHTDNSITTGAPINARATLRVRL